jgi:hypothetical protein
MPKAAHTKAAEAQESATRKAHQDFWDGHKSGLYCSDAACGVITTPKGNLKHILLYTARLSKALHRQWAK